MVTFSYFRTTRIGWNNSSKANYVRLVQEKFPNHFYLGEETATEKELDRLRSGLKDSEWTWIVDPIDGTLNFVSYFPSVVGITEFLCEISFNIKFIGS